MKPARISANLVRILAAVAFFTAAATAPDSYRWELDLTADSVPETANVVLATPNESGESSNRRQLYETYTDIQTMSN
jgi:hypothetical protein